MSAHFAPEAVGDHASTRCLVEAKAETSRIAWGWVLAEMAVVARHRFGAGSGASRGVLE